MHKYFYFFAPNTKCALVVALSEKSNTIQHGCRKCRTHARVFFQGLPNGNSKNEIKGKRRGVSSERSKVGTKEKRSHDGLSLRNQKKTIIINIIWFIQLNSINKKNRLEQSKNEESSTLARVSIGLV